MLNFLLALTGIAMVQSDDSPVTKAIGGAFLAVGVSRAVSDIAKDT